MGTLHCTKRLMEYTNIPSQCIESEPVEDNTTLGTSYTSLAKQCAMQKMAEFATYANYYSKIVKSFAMTRDFYIICAFFLALFFQDTTFD